jgi:hypothetical protein
LDITIEFFKYYIKVIRMANEDSIGKALAKVIIYSVIFVVAMGIIQWFFTGGLQILYNITGIGAILGLENYSIYAIILVMIIFGWFVIVSVASMFYAIFKPKYGESTASAIRSLIKILGIGGLFAGIWCSRWWCCRSSIRWFYWYDSGLCNTASLGSGYCWSILIIK